jgi:hypothetical protein
MNAGSSKGLGVQGAITFLQIQRSNATVILKTTTTTTTRRRKKVGAKNKNYKNKTVMVALMTSVGIQNSSIS